MKIGDSFEYANAKFTNGPFSYIRETTVKALGLQYRDGIVRIQWVNPNIRPYDDDVAHATTFKIVSEQEASNVGMRVDIFFGKYCMEETMPPEKVYAELHRELPAPTDSRAPEEDIVSDVTYSAVFSDTSRQQPTDPSSWFNSLSSGRDDLRSHPADVAIHSLTKDRLDAHRDPEDGIRSIPSVADSIDSTVSTGGSLGQAGVNYVVAKFTQSDPELLSLYTEASQRLKAKGFIDNNRRLLKMLYMDFANEELDPSEKEAVAFLRSRRRREEISRGILMTVTPDNEESYPTERERKELDRLNAYFESLDAAGEYKTLHLYSRQLSDCERRRYGL